MLFMIVCRVCGLCVGWDGAFLAPPTKVCSTRCVTCRASDPNGLLMSTEEL